jgi:hypothetical protein
MGGRNLECGLAGGTFLRHSLVLFFLSTLAGHALATPATNPQSTPQQLAGVSATSEPPLILLKQDTPVHFMVVNEVSTKESAAGAKFKLRVDQPVESGGVRLLAVGDVGYGEVLAAQRSGTVGKPGQISARLLYVLLDGVEIPVAADMSSRGRGGGSEVALGMVGLGLMAPLALLARGNNAKIKAGERITGFIVHDSWIDVSKRPYRLVKTPTAVSPSTPNTTVTEIP